MSAVSSRSIRSRSGRGCRAISMRCISPTARWSSRATCYSRSTSGRSRPRSTRPGPIWRRRAPTRRLRRPIWRAAPSSSATRPSPSRPSISAPRPSASPTPPSPPRRRRRAPVAGRPGHRRVSPGNRVTGGPGGNTTLLAMIVSLDPIRFEFTFDEASYLRYERLSKTGQDMTSRDGSALVSLRLIDEPDYSHPGRMDFLDNVIERSAGTIRGRAVFANPNGVFAPGMFGRLRVPGSPSYQALLVPDAAIGTDQARKYVLVVDGENVVRQKYVTLGQVSDNLRVIKEGLAPEDQVIVNGLMRALPGQKVIPQEEGAPPPAPGPAQVMK